ncbi:DUF1272 domain-containing protein [Aeromicrobium sp. A1-2]
MLDIRPRCECCDRDLDPMSDADMICTDERTRRRIFNSNCLAVHA